MKTLRLLLGSSDGLLNNFIEILVRDVCAEETLLDTSSARTVEGFILQGLTGRFDMAIVIPNSLLADHLSSRNSDPFSEASQAIGIIKKRCSMPVLALAAFNDRVKEEPILREAGTDRVFQLPFHPQEFAAAVRELLRVAGQRQGVFEYRSLFPGPAIKAAHGIRRWLPVHEFC